MAHPFLLLRKHKRKYFCYFYLFLKSSQKYLCFVLLSFFVKTSQKIFFVKPDPLSCFKVSVLHLGTLSWTVFLLHIFTKIQNTNTLPCTTVLSYIYFCSFVFLYFLFYVFHLYADQLSCWILLVLSSVMKLWESIFQLLNIIYPPSPLRQLVCNVL